MRNLLKCDGSRRWLFILSVGLLTTSGTLAQDIPSVRTGNFEIGAFAGESYGLDRFRPMLGGNVAYGVLTRYLYPFGEVSYLPGLLRSQPVGSGGSIKYSLNMTDVHGGLHIRFRHGESKFVPYAVVGAGIVRSSRAGYTSSLPGAPSIQRTLDPASSFAVNFGGGVRVFFNDRIGFRAEFKAFKPTSLPLAITNAVFYRFAIGPVFQLK